MDDPAATPTSARPLLLRMSRISKVFGGVRALTDVSFEVGRGEIVCLAGENGCGKSTLIKIVSGVLQPEASAEILWDGDVVTGLTPAQARRMGIQVIWQDLALFGELSVAENIAFERHFQRGGRWTRWNDLRARASEALERLGVTLPLNARLNSLPIADRQMVAIARALVADARLVFMDEPTASLSQRETDALLVIIGRLSASGIAVVFVSHRLAEVLQVCTRVTVLRDGKLVTTVPAAGMTQARLTSLMTGQVFDYFVRASSPKGKPVALRSRALGRGNEYADVDVTLHRGEVLGLVGRLGSGRTEFALTLFGITRPDRGTIELGGEPVRFRSNRDAIRAGVGYVSEDRLTLGLIQAQSIADNTVIAVLDDLVAPPGLLSPTRMRDLVSRWVQEFRIKIGQPEDPVRTLSGGNQQRVVLAKWLATKPSVLILDAPTVGVDVGARAEIFRIVRELASSGLAILLITDEVTEAYYNSDRILHMQEGRLVAEYTPGVDALGTIEGRVYA